MKNLKLIMKAPFSLEAIFELRKSPLFVALLAGAIFSMLLITSNALQFLKVETYRFDQSMWAFTEENYEEIEMMLPDCQVSDSQLVCAESPVIKVNDAVLIGFNQTLAPTQAGVVFNEDEILFSDGGALHELPYTVFEDFNFKAASADDVLNRVAASIQPVLVFSYVLAAYQIGFLVYFIYIVMVAAISMLLRFGHTSFVPYREVLKVMIFSSMGPVLIALIIGLVFTPGFETLIFQFGTPFVAYAVYRKQLIPHLLK